MYADSSQREPISPEQVDNEPNKTGESELQNQTNAYMLHGEKLDQLEETHYKLPTTTLDASELERATKFTDEDLVTTDTNASNCESQTSESDKDDNIFSEKNETEVPNHNNLIDIEEKIPEDENATSGSEEINPAR